MVVNQKEYAIHFAPMQGYTDLVFRNAFNMYIGGVDTFYTPFVRLESGDSFRNKDIRELEGNNTVPELIPQILPGSSQEFRLLAGLVKEKGFHRADINLGCPFPLIAGKKKGSGMLPYPELVMETLRTIEEFPDMEFSLKLRLGWKEPDECMELLAFLNNLRLCYITLHARIGKQQYKGAVDVESFGHFYEKCEHPLFYNGDLMTVEDIERIITRFPRLRGVAVGRGLLASPFLADDFYQEHLYSQAERYKRLREFLSTLYSGYAEYMQGETQLLMKMKSLWEYFLPAADKKLRKKIKKANRLKEYIEVINLSGESDFFPEISDI